MVLPLSLTQHTLYADLLEPGIDGLFDPDLPENGSILVRPNRAGAPADHAYYQGYRPAAGSNDRSQRYARYLGRSDDPAVVAQITRFQRVKSLRSERATTVRALIGAGMPQPDRITGRIIEALARAGLLPDDAILIGEAAYRTYDAVLGVRLSKPRKMAASDRPKVEIAVRNGDRLPDILDALHGVDPSFAVLQNSTNSQDTATYRSGSDVRVVVAIGRSHVDDQDPPDPMHFVLRGAIQAVVLYGPGIVTAVPAPERWLIRALILRTGLSQVTDLIAAILAADRGPILARAVKEARMNGSTWDARLQDSVSMLPADARRHLVTVPGTSDPYRTGS